MIQVELRNECDVKMLARELNDFMEKEGRNVIVVWGTKEGME